MKAFFLTFSICFLFCIAAFSQSKNSGNAISPQEFQKLLLNKSIVLIDVRTADEFSEGHIAGAINVDVNNTEFVSLLKTCVDGKSTALYCRSGRRSKLAVTKLTGSKIELFDLAGGIIAWQSAGLPVTTTASVKK